MSCNGSCTDYCQDCRNADSALWSVEAVLDNAAIDEALEGDGK